MSYNYKDSVLVGITGGIASGKSTIIRYLNRKGYSCIEADKLGHEILEPKNPSYKKILEKFGDTILDSSGNINRQTLGRIVFSNPKKLKQLNEISHPAIAKMIKKEFEKLSLSSLGGIVFLEAALLIETNWDKFCDQVWVVMLDPLLAKKRLQLRDGLSKEDAEFRLNAQLDPDLRRTRADLVLNNNNSSNDLLKQTDTALKELKSLNIEGFSKLN
tara:strand:- start:283 stop:930 length:648 start_codon:yes stop_codon:yes gene_type:complete